MALEALPDTVGHAFQVSTEKMIRLFTAAAVDEITWILALEAIVRILIF